MRQQLMYQLVEFLFKMEASSPSITYILDPSTGFYRNNNGQVSYTSNGSQIFIMNSNGIWFPNGMEDQPSISFILDPTTGFYRSNNGEVSFTSARVK